MKLLLIILLAGSLFHNLQIDNPLIAVEFGAKGLTILDVSMEELRNPVQQISDTNLFSIDPNAEWVIWSYGHLALNVAGTKIAYTATRSESAQLFIYDIVSNSRLSYSIQSAALQPQWSPDGSAILLHSPETLIGYGSETMIPDDYVFEFSSEHLYKITDTADYIERDWHWTDDSQRLVFRGRNSERNYQVFSVERNGQALTPITSFKQGSPRICNLMPHAGRWYYLVGCNDTANYPMDILYSTSLAGDNRLEFSIEDYFPDVVWAGIAAMRSLNNELFLLVKLINDTTGQYDQIIKLSKGAVIPIYEEVGYGYSDFVVDPQGGFVALYNIQALQIVDLQTGIVRFTDELPQNIFICDKAIQWQSGTQLIYNVGSSTNCNIPGSGVEGLGRLMIEGQNIINSTPEHQGNETLTGFLLKSY